MKQFVKFLANLTFLLILFSITLLIESHAGNSVEFGGPPTYIITPTTNYHNSNIKTITIPAPAKIPTQITSGSIGNASTDIAIDTASPTGSISINNGAAYTDDTYVSLALTCSDTRSGCYQTQFSNNNANWSTPETYSTAKNWSLTAGDGTKTVYVKFRDTAGNWSGAYSRSIILDTVPPVVTISSPASGIINTTAPTLLYTVSDGRVVVKVDGIIVNKVSGDTLDPLSSGTHTVRVEAIDAAGNAGFAQVSFTVDNVAPTVSITSPVAGTNNKTPLLTYTVSDGKVVVKVDGIIVNKVSGDMLDPLSNGTHTVRVEAIDAAGNASFAEVTFTVNATQTATSTSENTLPAMVLTMPKISGGGDYSLALTADGGLMAWGSNYSGELGDGTTRNNMLPEAIGADHTWSALSAGWNSSFALKNDGTLWTWGTKVWVMEDGVGYPSSYVSNYSPVQIGTDNNWKSVSTSGLDAAAIKTDGTLWTWGKNLFGESGNGTTTMSHIPAQVGFDKNWAAVSIGGWHTLALKSDGTLWAWGYNGMGQLGDGTTNNSNIPKQIGSANNWAAVSAQSYGSLALKADGTLWVWGLISGYGPQYVPVRIGTDTDWVAISSGGAYHALLLKSNGTLWAWGANWLGQLGDGTTGDKHIPTQIGTDRTWVATAAGADHSLAIKSDGSLWAWGYNDSGQVGDGTTQNRLTPYLVGYGYALPSQPLPTGRPSVSITSPTAGLTNNKTPLLTYTASDGTVAVKVDGTIVNKVSGNTLDPLSDGVHTVRVEATDATGNTGYAAVTFTVDTMAPTVSITSPVTGTTTTNTPMLTYTVSDGTVVVKVDEIKVSKVSGSTLDPLSNGVHTVRVEATDATGNTGYAEVTFAVNAPSTLQPIILPMSKISAGYGHSLAVAADGSLMAWGWNADGCLGDGTLQGKTWPVKIGTDNNWTAVSAGVESANSLAVKTDGTLWGWGNNSFGQLGLGSADSKLSPTQISGNNWASVSANGYSTAALKKDGTLWMWGANWYGVLGNGTTDEIHVPAQVGSASNWAAVSAGVYHTLALKTDGTLWGWGLNGFGELGDGTTNNRYTPKQIGSDHNWVVVEAGAAQEVSFGIKSDGTLWAWGYNGYYNGSGLLGDGTMYNRYSPIQIGTDKDWVAVSSRGISTLALKSDGTLWAWGWNWYGAFGDGTLVSKSFPVKIGSANDWASISVNYFLGLALKADGSLWNWGTGSVLNGWGGNNLTPYLVGYGYALPSQPLPINDGTAYTDTYSAPITTPSVSITSPAAGLTNNKTPLLTYTVSDGTVAVKVDGIAVNKVSGTTLGPLSDGVHTIRVEATNSAGTGFAEVSITVDTIAPTVSITSPVTCTTNNNTPILTYTVSDGTVAVKVDGIIVKKVSGSTLDPLSNGTHTVRVEATDAAGNVGYAAVTFTVDTIAPIVSITSPVAGTTSNNTPILTYTVSDGNVVVKMDGITVNKVSGSTLDPLAAGSHTVRVEATDAAWNIGYAEVTFTVSTDATAGGLGSSVSGASGSDPDATNEYCNGSTNYPVGPSSFTSGISLPPAGTNAVLIASPADGSTINGPKTIVKGAMDTTVPVMGAIVQVSSAAGTQSYPAQINGNYFAVKIYLSPDSNTIKVIATDRNNVQHQTSVTVTGVAQPSAVELQASPNSGIPTLKQNGQTTFDSTLSTTVSITNSASYAWDFSGGGSNNLTCYSHQNVTASYQEPGLYLTQVTVTDTEGSKYTDTAIVNVLDRASMDALFKQIWNGMKTALGSGDLEGSLVYLAESSRDSFRGQFNELNGFLPQISSDLGAVTLIEIQDNFAEYDLRITFDGATYSFQLSFIRASDGIWRIRTF